MPRPDGRTNDQLRPLVLERRANPYAEGSCLIRMGGTLVHCTASVEAGVPGFKKGSGEGWVTAEYGMLPRATLERTSRERNGPGGRTRVYSARDRARLKLTLRAKRLGLSLTEAKDILDMYDSPRDTVLQLKKFLGVLGAHRAQLESRQAELQANLDEVREQEKKTRATLARALKAKAA